MKECNQSHGFESPCPGRYICHRGWHLSQQPTSQDEQFYYMKLLHSYIMLGIG